MTNPKPKITIDCRIKEWPPPIAEPRFSGYNRHMELKDNPSLSEEDQKKRKEMFEAAVEYAISIGDRFSPEPVFGPTGKGYLKPTGVEELQKINEARENPTESDDSEKQDLEEVEIDRELLDRLLDDAVAISDRFSPEPVFGPTGKGYLKSVGVEEMKRWKESGE